MKFVLIILTIALNSYAFTPTDADKAGLIYFHQYDLNDSNINIIVEVDKGEQYFNLYDDKNKKIINFPMAQTEAFNKTEVTAINKYDGNIILSLWNKGAHGKQLFIHDIKSGKELLHIKSSYTLDYSIGVDHITVNWTGDMLKNNTPKKEQTIWPKK